MRRLREVQLTLSRTPLLPRASELIDQGIRRAKEIDCFDFVPSDYRLVWAVLDNLPRGRFCEWGSGAGVVTGLAEMLGFDACGIEIHVQLADLSRQLLTEFGLQATIYTGDYFELDHPADIYFSYCWPGQMRRVEERFLSTAPDSAQLVICHGAQDIRCRAITARAEP